MLKTYKSQPKWDIGGKNAHFQQKFATKIIVPINPFTLVGYTCRVYSSMGNPLGVKGLKVNIICLKTKYITSVSHIDSFNDKPVISLLSLMESP